LELPSRRGVTSERRFQQRAHWNFAVIVSAVGLAVIPVLTVPAMLLAGFKWRSAPRWTRLTLILGGVLFAGYLIALKPAAPHDA
jgi:uncharacterized membrane protein YgdD (TMEM256/DUF423 family)